MLRSLMSGWIDTISCLIQSRKTIRCSILTWRMRGTAPKSYADLSSRGRQCLSRLTLKVWKKRQAFTVKALAMYGMNMQFRVTTSPSIIRIITMRDLLIFRKNITTSASTGCMRLILSISIRSLRTVDFFRLQEVV